jgi:hypothetical protein
VNAYLPSRIDAGPQPFEDDMPISSEEITGCVGECFHHIFWCGNCAGRCLTYVSSSRQNVKGAKRKHYSIRTFCIVTVIETLVDISWNTLDEGLHLLPE